MQLGRLELPREALMEQHIPAHTVAALKAGDALATGRDSTGLGPQPVKDAQINLSRTQHCLNGALWIYKQQYAAVTKAISFSAILHSAI